MRKKYKPIDLGIVIAIAAADGLVASHSELLADCLDEVPDTRPFECGHPRLDLNRFPEPPTLQRSLCLKSSINF